MFGWTLIRKSTLKEYEKKEQQMQRFWLAHRWFSGWTDLEIIWDFISGKSSWGGVEKARIDYAKARKTNEYGKPLDENKP